MISAPMLVGCGGKLLARHSGQYRGGCCGVVGSPGRSSRREARATGGRAHAGACGPSAQSTLSDRLMALSRRTRPATARRARRTSAGLSTIGRRFTGGRATGPDAAGDVEEDPDGGLPPFRVLAGWLGKDRDADLGRAEHRRPPGQRGLCGGSLDQGNVTLTLGGAGPGDRSLRASVILDIKALGKGQTGTRKTATVSVLIAGAMGNIWRAEDACTADITSSAPAGVVPGEGTRYKLIGSARCPHRCPEYDRNGPL
jgi:hypothetical protein